MNTTMSRRRTTGPAILVALLLLASGCAAGDPAASPPEADLAAADDPADDSADEPADDAADDSADEPADDAADDTVEVTLVDYAFGGLPTSMPAGTRLSVVNHAEEELHEVVAFRLPDDEERSVADLVGLPPDELGAVLGEPATVLLAEPGGPQIDAVGDGTLAEPGRYALLCFIPVGASPQEYLAAAAESDGPPQVDGGPPHFVQGMYAEVAVD